MNSVREIEHIREYLNKEIVTRKEIVQAAKELGIKHGPVLRKSEKISHGVYNLGVKNNSLPTPAPKKVVQFPEQNKVENKVSENKGYVPDKDPCFVPFGDFSIIDSVVSSKKFMPLVITGDSGNGKTKMVEQACAKNKRNLTCRKQKT